MNKIVPQQKSSNYKNKSKFQLQKRPMLKKSRHTSSALASTVPIPFSSFSPQQEIPYVFPSFEENNMMRLFSSVITTQFLFSSLP